MKTVASDQTNADQPAVFDTGLSFIETQLPVGRISAESYKERKAGSGQTLTALGSYWKGRKPLIMVRASILGCLLPATDDPIADLRTFLILMGMDDESFKHRVKDVKPGDIDPCYEAYGNLIETRQTAAWNSRISLSERNELISEWRRDFKVDSANARSKAPQPSDISPDYARYDDLIEMLPSIGWRSDLSPGERSEGIGRWLSTLPYDMRLSKCYRPEEIEGGVIGDEEWKFVNGHLGTSAKSLSELVSQLGDKRFGRHPVVSDTFSGSGSIPFEAARMGCDVNASDLNPIACMLTWGAFNLIGKSNKAERAVLDAERFEAARKIDGEIKELGLENDSHGNRAKSFLYCLEARCPKTGWLVPLLPSFVISEGRKVIVRLVPDRDKKCYGIEVVSGASTAEMLAAATGTIAKGRLVHPINPDREGVAISVIRGDHRGQDGESKNRLRPWGKDDFCPNAEDIFQERLYAIQWVEKSSLTKGRPETFFKSVSDEDQIREQAVHDIVKKNLNNWQVSGLVPDLKIETGKENEGPIRTNGWTHWHHMFTARQLLNNVIIRKHLGNSEISSLIVAKCADYSNKSSQWRPRGDYVEQLFSGPSLRTQFNWGARSLFSLIETVKTNFALSPIEGGARIQNVSASDIAFDADIFVTDPPYADSVRYEEITEFFIAWLRRNPPKAFAGWEWSSSRAVAIKGTDEKFRSDMVAAYRAMSARMPDNGMQVVMFTHQDAGIWADLAAIMWAAGLRVTAAWNVVTETESALKEGNYVQGTILLVLRKRLSAGNIKRMDIEGEIEVAVDHQLAALNALDDDWTSERLYTDGDLQLAAYAAALRVITNYATIDRKEIGADVYRKVARGETHVIRELIEYAASVANNKLVPDNFMPSLWRELDTASRFYVRMLDMESKGTTKFADYQDFARTFSVADYADLMGSTKANAASLAGAGVLKGKMLGGKGFGSSPLRRVLFAVFKTMQKDDPREGMAFLKTEFGQDYWQTRMKLVELAKYVSLKTSATRPEESSAADLIAQRLEVDRL